jgi:hypothetical protein
VVFSIWRPLLLLCRSFLISYSLIYPSFHLVDVLMEFYYGSPCLFLCFTGYSLLFFTNYKVFSLILRSLIHFELILVQGHRHGSSFSFLQVDNHFSQQHLLKRMSFLHHMFFGAFVKNKVGIVVKIHIQIFYTVPVVFISVYVLDPWCFYCYGSELQFEVVYCDTSSIALFAQYCLSYLLIFVFPNEILVRFFNLCDECH